MRDELKGKHGHRDHGEHRERGEHRDRGRMGKHGMKDSLDSHPKSAQTFRRGRAIAFLDKLIVNRTTLHRQLEDPQFESIKQIITGELKATESIIDEFIHIFQIHEVTSDENTASDNKEEGGTQKNENN